MEFLPLHIFRQCVDRYSGNYKVKEFTCLDQYYSMAFAQITYRESLRDIEACLRAQHSKLYHMGIRGPVSRNTLANANKVRDWRIYADFALSLIATARRLYSKEAFLDDLNETVYALDATTIDLCLSLFPWAHFHVWFLLTVMFSKMPVAHQLSVPWHKPVGQTMCFPLARDPCVLQISTP